MSSPLRSELGAWPPLGYVETSIDRAAHLRPEAEKLLSDAAARACLLGGESVVLRPTDDAQAEAFLPIAAARAEASGDPLFLGLDGTAPRFAFPFDPGRAAELQSRGFLVEDLRPIAAQGLVKATDLGPLACAKALFGWHQRHRFCSNCGTPTRVLETGWRRECPACGAQHFPRTDPVVIMLVANGDRCLLGRQPHFRPGMWSCLAGFVEPGETMEDAVKRETYEEARITLGRISYFGGQPWPFPMSLMLGALAEATSEDIVMDPKELEAVRWFPLEEVRAMLLGTHPDGLFVPPPEAIAHHLIRAFVEGRRA